MDEHIKLDDLTQNPTCLVCDETLNIPRMANHTAVMTGFKQRHSHHDEAGRPDGEVTMNLAEHEERQMALRQLASDAGPDTPPDVVVATR